jgi:5-methylcytosine-specific restriction enzyme A
VVRVAVNPVYRSRAWQAVRRQVLARDGYQCQIRLGACRGRADSVDHIVELDDGGSAYALSNLQACCASCNTAKRNRAVAARAKRGAVRRRRWL